MFLGSKADLVSGLCRKRQLQIGVQEARKRRPELSDDALLELGKTRLDPKGSDERVITGAGLKVASR